LSLRAQVGVEVEQVFRDLGFLPGELLVIDLDLVPGFWFQLGFIFNGFAVVARGPGLVRLERDWAEDQPLGEETLVVDAGLLIGERGGTGEEQRRSQETGRETHRSPSLCWPGPGIGERTGWP